MSALRISAPGRPTVLIPERVPHLTSRQAQILQVVRAHNGNRSRAARELGVNVVAVQHALRLAARAGAFVPLAVTGRKGRRNRVQRALEPRCGLLMPLAGVGCGRPQGHPGGCVTRDAWMRGYGKPVA